MHVLWLVLDWTGEGPLFRKASLDLAAANVLMALRSDLLSDSLNYWTVVIALSLPSSRFGVVEGPIDKGIRKRVVAGSGGHHRLLRDNSELVLRIIAAIIICMGSVARRLRIPVQSFNDLILLLFILHKIDEVRILQILFQGVLNKSRIIDFLDFLLS